MSIATGLEKGDIVYIYRVGYPTKNGNFSVILPSKAMYTYSRPADYYGYFEFMEGKNKGKRAYPEEVCWCRTIEEAIEEFNRELDLRIEEENKKHEKIVEKIEKYRIL